MEPPGQFAPKLFVGPLYSVRFSDKIGRSITRFFAFDDLQPGTVLLRNCSTKLRLKHPATVRAETLDDWSGASESR